MINLVVKRNGVLFKPWAYGLTRKQVIGQMKAMLDILAAWEKTQK